MVALWNSWKLRCVGAAYRADTASYEGVWPSSTISTVLALVVDRKTPGIRQWPVYIHIRKRRAIWISASVVAHHREITPLYLIDNGNRLRGRKWLRLPREDGSTMVFALWLFNLPQRSISSLLCLSCISYICSSLAYLYLSYFSFNLIYLLFFYYLIYSLFIILKT